MAGFWCRGGLRPCYTNQPKAQNPVFVYSFFAYLFSMLQDDVRCSATRGAVTSVHAILRTCPKPCYFLRFCHFTQHAAGGCLMLGNTTRCHECSCFVRTCPKPCNVQHFCPFIKHGCSMFSSTRPCHKCSCHLVPFTNMPNTRTSTALLPLYTTRVAPNTSTAGSASRTWIQKQKSRITWGNDRQKGQA